MAEYMPLSSGAIHARDEDVEMRNFHVPLPDELHAELRKAADRRDQPATVLARQAIRGWLETERRRILHEEIRGFAERHAGTELDLDPDLEETGLEGLDEGSR